MIGDEFRAGSWRGSWGESEHTQEASTNPDIVRGFGRGVQESAKQVEGST